MESNIKYSISQNCDELPSTPKYQHNIKYIDILNSHGFNDVHIPIPLVERYSKGRRWTELEFESCYNAWREKIPLTVISASLNRNPQDIIYKLLKRCKIEGVKFTQKDRTLTSNNWTPRVAKCAAELFDAGLTAWRIAVLFQVEFEFVEKAMFKSRKGYGHDKRNPFTIYSDHKQFINEKVLNKTNKQVKINRVLEPYGGEGRFTEVLLKTCKPSYVLCLEKDDLAFSKASNKIWPKSVHWKLCDNTTEMALLCDRKEKFDLIDLDPFVSCREQFSYSLDLLSDDALLFINFGGEYRRSFIKGNRKSLKKHYNIYFPTLDNKQYLEIVPSYYLGWVAKVCAEQGFSFDVLFATRYANFCRFWLKTKRCKGSKTIEWFTSVTTVTENGTQFKGLVMPRFREIRKEFDNYNQKQLTINFG